MVKGISKQVILLHAPETDVFEQAIFILKDHAQSVTDDMLLKEAMRIINSPQKKRFYGPLWALSGAALMGILWVITVFL